MLWRACNVKPSSCPCKADDAMGVGNDGGECHDASGPVDPPIEVGNMVEA